MGVRFGTVLRLPEAFPDFFDGGEVGQFAEAVTLVLC
jgi:hypothetical protein